MNRAATGATPRGQLTLFSAAERSYCEPLLNGFHARHPAVEIDFWRQAIGRNNTTGGRRS